MVINVQPLEIDRKGARITEVPDDQPCDVLGLSPTRTALEPSGIVQRSPATSPVASLAAARLTSRPSVNPLSVLAPSAAETRTSNVFDRVGDNPALSPPKLASSLSFQSRPLSHERPDPPTSSAASATTVDLRLGQRKIEVSPRNNNGKKQEKGRRDFQYLRHEDGRVGDRREMGRKTERWISELNSAQRTEVEPKIQPKRPNDDNLGNIKSNSFQATDCSSLTATRADQDLTTSLRPDRVQRAECYTTSRQCSPTEPLASESHPRRPREFFASPETLYNTTGCSFETTSRLPCVGPAGGEAYAPLRLRGGAEEDSSIPAGPESDKDLSGSNSGDAPRPSPTHAPQCRSEPPARSTPRRDLAESLSRRVSGYLDPRSNRSGASPADTPTLLNKQTPSTGGTSGSQYIVTPADDRQPLLAAAHAIPAIWSGSEDEVEELLRGDLRPSSQHIDVVPPAFPASARVLAAAISEARSSSSELELQESASDSPRGPVTEQSEVFPDNTAELNQFAPSTPGDPPQDDLTTSSRAPEADSLVCGGSVFFSSSQEESTGSEESLDGTEASPQSTESTGSTASDHVLEGHIPATADTTTTSQAGSPASGQTDPFDEVSEAARIISSLGRGRVHAPLPPVSIPQLASPIPDRLVNRAAFFGLERGHHQDATAGHIADHLLRPGTSRVSPLASPYAARHRSLSPAHLDFPRNRRRGANDDSRQQTATSSNTWTAQNGMQADATESSVATATTSDTLRTDQPPSASSSGSPQDRLVATSNQQRQPISSAATRSPMWSHSFGWRSRQPRRPRWAASRSASPDRRPTEPVSRDEWQGLAFIYRRYRTGAKEARDKLQEMWHDSSLDLGNWKNVEMMCVYARWLEPEFERLEPIAQTEPDCHISMVHELFAEAASALRDSAVAAFRSLSPDDPEPDSVDDIPAYKTIQKLLALAPELWPDSELNIHIYDEMDTVNKAWEAWVKEIEEASDDEQGRGSSDESESDEQSGE